MDWQGVRSIRDTVSSEQCDLTDDRRGPANHQLPPEAPIPHPSC